MEIKFSQEMISVAGFAREEAMRTGHYGIDADHLMLGLLRHGDNDACRALADAGIDLDALKDDIDKSIFMDRSIPYFDMDRVNLTEGAVGVLTGAGYEALKSGTRFIAPAHLLLSILRGDGHASELLASAPASYDSMRTLMINGGYLGSECTLKVPDFKLMQGALGEQLGKLFDTVRTQTNTYS